MNRKIKISLLGRLFGRLPVQEEINFARHLAIIVKAGLPVFEGLKIIRKQVQMKRFVKIMDQIIVDVNNGQSLADALTFQGNAFSPFFINVIKVGESSGTLADNLRYLADELAKNRMLRSKIHSAMVYPMVILVATIAIVSGLIFFIFPKIIPLFKSLKVTLPFTTRALIAITDFMSTQWFWVIGAVLLLVVAVRMLFLLEGVRYLFQKTLLYVPVVSSLAISVNVINFSRVMGLLLKSGIRIVEALKIVSGTSPNLVYERALLATAIQVEKGGQMGGYLALQKKLFPPLFSSMVEIGENTGNLQENLEYLSEYYTEELDIAVKNLTTLIEPILLLFMGLLVGFVALSIITPIYSITQGLTPK